MAVTPTSPSKPISKKKNNEKKKEKKISDSVQPLESSDPLPPPPTCSSPAKRTKCPGVCVIGGRIYDFENGKTCHQVWWKGRRGRSVKGLALSQM
ncbi:hypothetical protein BVC80_1817g12 [Macleaya cordata]|uniref:Uncharacterized protein n=1 Tax=Macleaya cordata TaxID=56857 RepID=A0A200QW30_MACCD|nr:hypothetical protein BVC80_1817g12 [Macleaya cordata]